MDEISREASKGDPMIAEQVKNRLWNKSWEEAYTLNFLMGKIIFTSSWWQQDKLENLESKHIPEAIKEKLIKKAKIRRKR